MSISLMNAVWKLDSVKTTHKFILLSLADQANDAGVCWPSIPTIAKRCSVTERSVYRIISELQDSGFLEVNRDSKKSNCYTLSLLPECHTCQNVTPDTVSPLPLTGCHPPPDTVSPKPLKNHQLEPSYNKHQNNLNLGFEEFWEAYAYKKGKRAALNVWRSKKLHNIKESVIAGARGYAASRDDDPRFWKHPQGWLTAGRWEDEAIDSTEDLDQRRADEAKYKMMRSNFDNGGTCSNEADVAWFNNYEKEMVK